VNLMLDEFSGIIRKNEAMLYKYLPKGILIHGPKGMRKSL